MYSSQSQEKAAGVGGQAREEAPRRGQDGEERGSPRQGGRWGEAWERPREGGSGGPGGEPPVTWPAEFDAERRASVSHPAKQTFVLTISVSHSGFVNASTVGCFSTFLPF